MSTSKPQKIPIADGELLYYSEFLDEVSGISLFEQLQATINWTTRTLKLYGKERLMPRLLAWYADPGVHYEYSGGRSPHNDWTPALLQLKNRVETVAEEPFNGALLNLYRDGQDSMGWHSDDEAALGTNPTIASISLGAERIFHLQHKYKAIQTIKIALQPGSLLLMRGSLQRHWQHQLPKTRRQIGARINITYRWVAPEPVPHTQKHL